jgi:guanylate kinase
LKANNLSFVISGLSGAGKTTLINMLLSVDARLAFSISTTTRPKRPGETDGSSYYFIEEPSFRAMIDGGSFIEWAKVHGNYYGTAKKEIDRILNIGKIPVFDVDVQGAKALRSALGGAVYIFIIPPSLGVLESRLRHRKTDSEEQIRIRLRNAVSELKEFALYDYIVVNDDLDTALNQIKSIVTAEMCKKDRVSNIITGILEDAQ